MKKTILSLLLAFSGLTSFTSCHHDTLEDRAEKEATDYTSRYCPTPFTDNQRTDSVTFTRADRTFHYYYTLRDVADNPELILQNKSKLAHALQEDLNTSTQSKVYKDAGFTFHYVFRSATTGKTLLEQKLKGSKANKR